MLCLKTITDFESGKPDGDRILSTSPLTLTGWSDTFLHPLWPCDGPQRLVKQADWVPLCTGGCTCLPFKQTHQSGLNCKCSFQTEKKKMFNL